MSLIFAKIRNLQVAIFFGSMCSICHTTTLCSAVTESQKGFLIASHLCEVGRGILKCFDGKITFIAEQLHFTLLTSFSSLVYGWKVCQRQVSSSKISELLERKECHTQASQNYPCLQRGFLDPFSTFLYGCSVQFLFFKQ